MHDIIISMQRRSLLKSLVRRMLPVTRINTILYLGVFFCAVIINTPLSTTQYDQIVCEDEIEYGLLHTQYPKLTFERYMVIKISCHRYSHKNIIPVYFMCAIANNESGMCDTAVSYTGDYGFFQINAYHQYRGKNPEDLFDFVLNTKLAVNYYSQCYDKALAIYSKREISQSFRFYNAGMGSDVDKYNNWDYVIDIMDDIQESEIAMDTARSNIRLAANY